MQRVLAAAASLLLVPLAVATATPFDQAFDRMYNFDFPAAHSILDRYVAERPDEPLPYAIRGAAYLFTELDRLGILEGQFFSDDKRIAEKKRLAPDPNIRTKFLKAVDDAQARANKVLAVNANDCDALFAMAVTQGVITDYMALVEKRQIASLSSARQSNAYAQRLLQINPSYQDAYLTTGFTEYMVGSLPFFVRWFIRFDNVSGNKQKGIDLVSKVAHNGRYLKSFAKILLSIAYLRDKEYVKSRDLMADLSKQYPANQLFRKELKKLDAMASGNAN